MNVVLLVIDSLRKCSLVGGLQTRPATPFMDALNDETVSFGRAYATECWTLPTHLSMFTGLLPSEHGAHFQSMAYLRDAPTIAELLSRAGVETELITRNSIFDGSLPGVTRGFRRRFQPLAKLDRRLIGMLGVLALAKPRVRRLIRQSGFFHAVQKDRGSFLATLARMGIPADELALQCALERIEVHRRRRKRFFLFVNLYDVHAPYSPSSGSPLRSLDSLGSLLENLALPVVLPKISNHAYLRTGFRLSDRHRKMLLRRYHDAIELMDGKLARFFAEARRLGALEDTVVIVTSDHGEAFGEHGLYLHDASVYDTHLHVPLWIHHPDEASRRIDDVVSTRDLFGLMQSIALGGAAKGTILDTAYRRANGAAFSEHFHYPQTHGVLERFSVNQAAVVVGRSKLVRRGSVLEHYDLEWDPGEFAPRPIAASEISEVLRTADFPTRDSIRIIRRLEASMQRRAA